MPNYQLKIAKHTDKGIFDRIQSLAQVDATFVPSKVIFNVPSFDANGQECEWNKVENNQFLKLILQNDSSFLLNHIHFHYPKGIKFSIARKDGEMLTDDASVTPIPNDVPLSIKAIDLFKRHFDEVTPSKWQSEVLGNQLKALYDAREINLNKQEERLSNFFSEMEKFNLRLTENQTKKLEDLEKIFVERQSKLDTDYQSKLDALRTREDELAKRQAEFDLRESKGVRREIRKEFKQDLIAQIQKIQVRPETEKMRTPVWTASIVAIGVLAALAVFFIIKDAFAGTIDAFLIARQVTFTFAAVGFAFFFIRWNNQWFQRHADEEFKLKALGFDIDKASWLFELGLEWRKENQTDIPEPLLKAIKGLLFSSQAGKQDVDGPSHSMEEIATLLFGATKGITLRADGPEIALNPKALKKAISKEDK